MDFRGEGARLWISRQVLREFLAVRSRPQTFSSAGRASEIAAHVGRFERIFRVAEDDASVTSRLLDLFERVPFGGRQVHDANIVATMLVHGIPSLLTDNIEDFRRFLPLVAVRSLED